MAPFDGVRRGLLHAVRRGGVPCGVGRTGRTGRAGDDVVAVGLEVLVPVMTSTGVQVMRRSQWIAVGLKPVVPIVRNDGTTIWHEPPWAPPPDPGASMRAPVVVADRPAVESRTPWSLGVRWESGFFSPDALEAALSKKRGIDRTMALFFGLGGSVEYRPTEIFGISVAALGSLAPSSGDETLYGLSASTAARLYVPAIPTFDVALGAEVALHWMTIDKHSAFGAGFTWRFGFQLRDPDLPAVLVTLFFRRAVVDDDGYEIDFSGAGVMADFFFDT